MDAQDGQPHGSCCHSGLRGALWGHNFAKVWCSLLSMRFGRHTMPWCPNLHRDAAHWIFQINVLLRDHQGHRGQSAPWDNERLGGRGKRFQRNCERGRSKGIGWRTRNLMKSRVVRFFPSIHQDDEESIKDLVAKIGSFSKPTSLRILTDVFVPLWRMIVSWITPRKLRWR